MDELHSILDGSGILSSNGISDKLIWEGNNSKSFSVKSLYELANHNALVVNSAFDLIWRNIAPHRVQRFGWLVHLGRIKSSEYLFRLGIIRNEEEACCKFCLSELETVDHLLLHCQPVWQLWSKIMYWWGVKWVSPKSVVDLFFWWKDWTMNKQKRLIWEAFPMAVLWNVRNKIVFENEAPNWDKTSDLILSRVAFWIKSKEGSFDFSLDDFN